MPEPGVAPAFPNVNVFVGQQQRPDDVERELMRSEEEKRRLADENDRFRAELAAKVMEVHSLQQALAHNSDRIRLEQRVDIFARRRRRPPSPARCPWRPPDREPGATS